MKYSFRPLSPNERLYTFKNSQQISLQTGFIGHLFAFLGKENDNSFLSTWIDFRKDRKTEEFKDEFDDIINSLRSSNEAFYNRKTLADFCNNLSVSKFKEIYYGIRIDTAHYAYLFRLNPNKTDYNVYCYCYEKEMLDNHIRNTENGIRFIASDYKELFRVNDGAEIEMKFPNGSSTIYQCRYIDNYHVEIGDFLYHICEFGELIERNDITVTAI